MQYFKVLLEAFRRANEQHPTAHGGQPPAPAVPGLDWPGWGHAAELVGVQGDAPAFRARQATKIALAADELNLSGKDVDWPGLEGQLEGILAGLTTLTQLPDTVGGWAGGWVRRPPASWDAGWGATERRQQAQPAKGSRLMDSAPTTKSCAPTRQLTNHHAARPAPQEEDLRRQAPPRALILLADQPAKSRKRGGAATRSYCVVLEGQAQEDAEWWVAGQGRAESGGAGGRSPVPSARCKAAGRSKCGTGALDL